MSKNIIKQRRSFKKILETRKEVIKRYPAIAGNGTGLLSVPDRSGYIYVTIDGTVYQAASPKIAPVYNSQIIVGVSGEDGTKRIYQVLGYAANAMNNADVNAGGKHAHTHEWMKPGGGQDPVRTHLRAFTHLEIGMSPNRGLNIFLFNGIVFNGENYIAVPSQEIDLTAQVPSSTDKAALVMITIDTNGAVVQTKGAEVDISAIVLPSPLPDVIPNLPARPAGTIWTCGAVRVYNGQTDILDARVNGDFIDLRFTNETGAGAGYLVNPVEYIDFDLTGTATPNTEGRVSWNPDDGTVEVGMPGGEVVMQVGQEILLPRQVINDVGADCFNGQIIYINSGDNNNLKFKLAKADAEVTSASTLAMLTENIPNSGNKKGFATSIGLVRGSATQPIDTSADAPGTVLYLSPTTAGAFTSTKPAAPFHAVSVGTVFRQHISEGAVLVHITNGFELGELHDVDTTESKTTPVDADAVLLRDSEDSNIWKELTWANLKTGIGAITGSGIVGRVAEFSGTGTIQSAKLIAPTGDVLTLVNANAKSVTFPGAANDTVAMLAQANVFSNIAPLQTAAESWIGPTSTTGIYFYNGAVGFGTIPVGKFHVYVTGDNDGLKVQGSGTGGAQTRLMLGNNGQTSGKRSRFFTSTPSVDGVILQAGDDTYAFVRNIMTWLNDGNVIIGGVSGVGLFNVFNTSDIVAQVLKGFSSQTEDLQRWVNSSDTILASVSATGTVKSSGRRQATTTKTANYTATVNDEVIRFTTSATLTLPAATGSGQTYTVIADGCAVTVDGNASETINNVIIQTLTDGDAMILHDVASGKWCIG